MVPLRPCGADLSAFHAAVLFEPAVILLDSPGERGVGAARRLAHVLVAGGPVLGILRVPGCGNDPEDAYEAIPAQVHAASPFRNRARRDDPVPGPVGVDLPVAFHTREPPPAKGAYRL